jgi:hypothetical protein
LELTEEYFFAAGFFGLPALTDWALIGKAGSGFLWRPARIPVNLRPSDGVGVEIARRICADCPVREPCLEYALYNRIDHGVWGGASERERRRIARRRRLEEARARRV